MDFSIAQKDGDFVVLTTHTVGPPDDASPLQFISAERLADLERIEAEKKAELAEKAAPQTQITE